MSAVSEFKSTVQKNKQKADQQKAAKRASKAMEGTPYQRFCKGAVRWTKRIFFTAFFCMFVYVLVMSVTLMIPYIMALIISSLGYTLETLGELFLAALCGIFFVLWAFAITLFLVKKVYGVYAKAMKGTAKAPIEPVK